MKAALLLADPEAHGRYREVVQRVGSSLMLIDSHGQKRDSQQSLYFYEGFRKQKNDPTEMAQEIRESFGFEPRLLYGADLAYLCGRETEDEILARTYFTIQRAEELIDQYDFRFLFTGSGGTLFANAFFQVADRRGVDCYRMHPIQYLDTELDTRRFFFCKNNFHRTRALAVHEQKTSRYEQCRQKAKMYVNFVRDQKLRPDGIAREFSKQGMFTARSLPEALLLGSKLTVKKVSQGLGIGSHDMDRDRMRLKAYLRKSFLDRTKTKRNANKPYFIFILHHPHDSQLTLRGRHFADQIALARVVARNLPAGCELLVKEHPVMPGMIPVSDIRTLEQQYPEVIYVDYSQDFRPLVEKAAGVVVINSTAGLESLILGKPVVVLGEAFYRDQPFVYSVGYLRELTEILHRCLVEPRIATDDELIQILADLFYDSTPGPEENGDDTVSYLAQAIQERMKPLSDGSVIESQLQ